MDLYNIIFILSVLSLFFDHFHIFLDSRITSFPFILFELFHLIIRDNHHSYGLCIGDHRGQIIVYAAQDMSAECYNTATACVYHLFVRYNVGTIEYRSINKIKDKLSD